MKNIQIGDMLTCSVTGVQFIAARVGITMNYACMVDGGVACDAGVMQWLAAQVAKRVPVGLYITGNKVTGWKSEHILGSVISCTTYGTAFGEMRSVTVRMFDGSLWYGKYSYTTLEIATLRHYKTAQGAA